MESPKTFFLRLAPIEKHQEPYAPCNTWTDPNMIDYSATKRMTLHYDFCRRPSRWLSFMWWIRENFWTISSLAPNISKVPLATSDGCSALACVSVMDTIEAFWKACFLVVGRYPEGSSLRVQGSKCPSSLRCQTVFLLPSYMAGLCI